MRKQNIYFFLSALILALGCGKNDGSKEKKPARGIQVSGESLQNLEKKPEDPKLGKELISPEKYGRLDPFDPVCDRVLKEDVLGLKLEGIILNEDSPTVIINGKIVGLGDSIGPNKVIKIEPNKVLLFDGRQEFELRLGR